MKRGYFEVSVHGHKYRVHRLVALAFLPNPSSHPYINHKNGIKTDNRPHNLEWCSPSQNSFHAYASGLIVQPNGERHRLAKLNEAQVREIFLRVKIHGETIRSTAKEYGVNYSTIFAITSGRSWYHLNLVSR